MSPRGMGPVAGLVLAAAVVAAACAGRAATERSDAVVPPVEGVAASAPLPERWSFGRAATQDEIRRIDIDVRGQDGLGLPPGSGTPAEGAALYAARCAGCHGVDGEGIPRVGTKLVGRRPDDAFDFHLSEDMFAEKTIGSYWPYAPTLFDYIRRAMPFDRPGSLTDREVYALTAHLLHANGIIPADAVMDAGTLPAVRMPAYGRFVPDDRETSTRVR